VREKNSPDVYTKPFQGSYDQMPKTPSSARRSRYSNRRHLHVDLQKLREVSRKRPDQLDVTALLREGTRDRKLVAVTLGVGLLQKVWDCSYTNVTNGDQKRVTERFK